MRIVHVADSFPPDVGGIERQVEMLAGAQRADGHDVSVITAVNKPPNGDAGGLDVHRGLRVRWLTIAFPSLNARMVAQVLDREPVDVVHAHFTVASPIAVYVARAAHKRGIPVAVTVHSVWWKVAVAHRFVTWVFFGPAPLRPVYSGVSSMIAGHIKRTYPREKTVSVVPNLVDTDWWKPTEPPQHQTGVPEFRIVLVGRLKKRKQIDEFIEIMSRVKAKVAAGTPVSVSIVGAGPRRDELNKQIEELDLGDWITLLGHRTPEQIRDLLHEADLFIAPSRKEAFGIAALEARSAGVPVLGYRFTGLADFIRSGVEGLLVEDQDDMVDTLAKVLVDREGLDQLKTSTRSHSPSVTFADAMEATYAFYRRARQELGRG
ncbi:glycosyltransferase family 4 protein [Flexivirga sp. ID2601S]|uniref:D-inositol 3-phosphate glycosyltransferase n=1 Tax=Flexivirga aerilata TaxID=1656889 RepID=A0A849AK91_9MICO|nr:glycosyltransferase family 4 protein [Flexivirga aerilata]NNG40779.1 glycosyltransferase family 4 protein [Flexivirga aerilata]